MIVLNKTRYYTEDLQNLADKTLQKYRICSYIVVEYYTPSKGARESYMDAMGTGLFVKFLRTGDHDNLYRKSLKLVKPTRFPGISDLEALGTADGEGPRELVRQVIHRLRMMSRFAYSHKRPGAVDASYNIRDLDKFVESNGLRLRFRTRDPSREELLWRDEMARARSDLENAAISVGRAKEILDHAEKDIYESLVRRDRSEKSYKSCRVHHVKKLQALSNVELRGKGMIE